jgi:hypothetical protein
MSLRVLDRARSLLSPLRLVQFPTVAWRGARSIPPSEASARGQPAIASAGLSPRRHAWNGWRRIPAAATRRLTLLRAQATRVGEGRGGGAGSVGVDQVGAGVFIEKVPQAPRSLRGGVIGGNRRPWAGRRRSMGMPVYCPAKSPVSSVRMVTPRSILLWLTARTWRLIYACVDAEGERTIAKFTLDGPATRIISPMVF